MKTLTARFTGRAALLGAVITVFATGSATAQDCWLPDAFEPNDVVPVNITTGSYTGLSLHKAGLNTLRDVDRFLVRIPPYQRLTLDFENSHANGQTAPETVSGSIEPVDQSDERRVFLAANGAPDEDAVYDNPFGQDLDVLIELRGYLQQQASCLHYDMSVALGPRPCDVLSDDLLEGPDDCGGGTILQPGLHSDLIVFGSRRRQGRDGDVFRIPSVPPRETFTISPILDGGDWETLTFDVFSDPACQDSVWSWSDRSIQHLGASPRDFFVSVDTTAQSGYQRYGIGLQFEPCSQVSLDAFEPNDRCGPYTPISIGTYTGLTLGDGDVDSFELLIPPYSRLVVDATAHVDEYQLAVRGAITPGCPDLHPSSIVWRNDTGTARPFRFSVEAVTNGCTSYDLDISTELPLPCTNAATALEEPNDDCATATVIAQSADGSGGRAVTLQPGDEDFFRIEVPAESVLRVELSDPNIYDWNQLILPTLILDAFPGGDCSATPLRSVRPMQDTTHDGIVIISTHVDLVNRSDLAEEWVLRTAHGQPVSECRGYNLYFHSFHVDEIAEYANYHDTSCQEPTPLRDSDSIVGPLAPSRPLFGSVSLQPGQVLEVELHSGFARAYPAPVRLSLHLGSADCASGGASLGSASIDPLFFPPPPADVGIFLTHTNTSGNTQRVIAELALGPQAGVTVSHARFSMRVDGERPYRTQCSSLERAPWRLGCPCGNIDETSPVYEGCANSTGSGSWLHATGTPSIAADDLELHLEGMPPHAPAIIYHATNAHGSEQSFFDGLLCATSGVNYSWPIVADGSGRWDSAETTVSFLSNAGVLAYASQLQCWYRDPAGPCGSRSNTSNAILIDWLP